MKKHWYKNIVLAIADYFKHNQMFINEQPVTHCCSQQYNDIWHGIQFNHETENVNHIKIYIAPFIDCEDIKDIFLETDISYKDNHEEESFIYKNISFPKDLSEVETFCKLFINEYVPNILANKDILTLSEKPTLINF